MAKRQAAIDWPQPLNEPYTYYDDQQESSIVYVVDEGVDVNHDVSAPCSVEKIFETGLTDLIKFRSFWV